MKVNYLANRYFTDGQFQCYEFRSSKVMDESPHFIEIELKSTTQKKKKKKISIVSLTFAWNCLDFILVPIITPQLASLDLFTL